MSDTVLVALLSLAGTLLGSGLGILGSARLVNYRLAQLEKQVQSHNCLIERTYKLEETTALHQERFRGLDQRIVRLERKQ